MTDTLKCQDFVTDLQPGHLIVVNNTTLATVKAVIVGKTETIVHYSPKDHPEWKAAVVLPNYEIVTSYITLE